MNVSGKLDFEMILVNTGFKDGADNIWTLNMYVGNNRTLGTDNNWILQIMPVTIEYW